MTYIRYILDIYIEREEMRERERERMRDGSDERMMGNDCGR